MRKASSKDVAAALGVEPTTVQRYAREGRIPFDVTPGRHRRFDVDEVVAALKAEEPTFIAQGDFPGMGTGRTAARSRSAARLVALRTARAEEPATAGTAPGGAGSTLGGLMAGGRRILVATAR